MLSLILATLASVLGLSTAIRRPRLFIVFLLCAGTLRFGADDIVTGYNLSSIWLAVLIGLGILAILRTSRSRRKAWACFLPALTSPNASPLRLTNTRTARKQKGTC